MAKSELDDWGKAEYKRSDLGELVHGKYAKHIRESTNSVVLDPTGSESLSDDALRKEEAMTDEGWSAQKASRVIGQLPLEVCAKRCSELRDYVRWIHRLRNDEKALVDFESSCERVERAIKENVENNIVNEAQAQDLRGIHIREAE